MRALLESVATVAYTGGWPARVLERIPAFGRVTRIEHRLPLLPPRPDHEPRRPLRLAFASDLHLGPLTPRHLLDRAFAVLTEIAPDVLVLGGDYVYLEATPALADELSARVAAVPAAVKVAVLGNHDLWTDHALIEAALERAGVRVLINDAAFLPAPHDDVAIVGLDEPWSGDADPDRAFAAAAGARLTVAVAHSPEGYPFVRGRGAPLLLTGHTHGGQIAAPSGPIVVHGALGRRWPAGLFKLPDLQLYVSRGLGMVDLPLRLFAAPDVTLFTLATS